MGRCIFDQNSIFLIASMIVFSLPLFEKMAFLKKMLWVDGLFDQDSIFLIGSMSIVYGLCKRGGESSNVHVVLKGGHQNVHVCSQGGGGV